MTTNRLPLLLSTLIVLLATAAVDSSAEAATAASNADSAFADDVAFLRQHVDVVVLGDAQDRAQVALVPAWQGRVMTSTADRQHGRGFGWINRTLIASGKLDPHINAFGGEDRLWLGPEGGQFSIFFAKDAPFDLEHWFVPKQLDTLPFKVVRQSRSLAAFASEFSLVNYSGTRFQVKLQREVELLETDVAWRNLGLPADRDIALVAYESRNTLTNAGKEPWQKRTGLLSLWILGMFNSSPASTVVIPFKPGLPAQLGPQVTSDYFGAIPSSRLAVTDHAVFLKADAAFRSKIGISPQRSLGKLGSYDADHRVLTLVQFTQPAGVTDYVNSLWKRQEQPFAGDAANAYNDGPPAPGAKALGPFFELESSSPAAALTAGASLQHVHRTLHLTGPEAKLDKVARAVLGVSLAQIASSLNDPPGNR